MSTETTNTTTSIPANVTTAAEAVGDVVEQLRALTIGAAPEFKRKTVTVKVNGKSVTLEVRQPRAEERDEILRAGAIITGKNPNMKLSPMAVLAAVLCTYAPGTDRRVFRREDVPAMLQRPAGDFPDVLGTEALQLMNAGAEEQGNG